MTAPASLLDQFLPRYDFAARHSLRVAARAARGWDALRTADLRDPAIARVLLFLRGYGMRARRQTGDASLAVRLAALGFTALGERPGQELVFGLVGRFWTPSGGLRPVAAAEYLEFKEDGFAKAAWNFSVEPRDDSDCLLTTETRVLCFGEAARRRFRRYWRVVGPFSGIIRKGMLRSIREHALRRTDGS